MNGKYDLFEGMCTETLEGETLSTIHYGLWCYMWWFQVIILLYPIFILLLCFIVASCGPVNDEDLQYWPILCLIYSLFLTDTWYVLTPPPIPICAIPPSYPNSRNIFNPRCKVFSDFILIYHQPSCCQSSRIGKLGVHFIVNPHVTYGGRSFPIQIFSIQCQFKGYL